MSSLHSHSLKSLLVAAAVALVAHLPLRAADEWVRYQSQPTGSKVTIAGTSTIHDWTVESQLIGGYMEFDAQFPSDPSQAIKIKPKVNVTIPVRSLKSGKPSMDDVMLNAMKQKAHPNITYQLTEITLKEPPKTSGGPIVFDTKGALTVSGVTRTNAMQVTMEPMPNDKIKVTGATDLKMTDFGIKPPAPALALGLIKTGDDVKITFEWLTVKKAPGAK